LKRASIEVSLPPDVIRCHVDHRDRARQRVCNIDQPRRSRDHEEDAIFHSLSTARDDREPESLSS
jgi:hypothetical protein